MTGPSDSQIARAKAVDLAEVVGRTVRLRRRGREHEGLCPFHAERTPSFTVVPRRAGESFYHCFGCGAHGDAIAFLRTLHGLSFAEAVAELTGESIEAAGDAAGRANRVRRPAPPSPDPDQVAAREARARTLRAERAEAIWRAAEPAEGTIVEVYLRGRGIPLELIGWPLAALRHHPALAYYEPVADPPPEGPRVRHLGDFPAMVAAIRDRRGRLLAAHCTYLAVAVEGVRKLDLGADPQGKNRPAKKMQGTAQGGSIALAPRAASGLWLVGEGIETCLSVLAAERRAGRDSCVEAAGSLGNLAGGGVGQGFKHPWRKGRHGRPLRLPDARPDPQRPGIVPPAWARSAVVLADGDGKDPPSQRCLEARAEERFRRLVGRARTAKPPAGLDFNDLLQQEAGRTAGPTGSGEQEAGRTGSADAAPANTGYGRES